MLPQARASRFQAENKGRTATMDVVTVETEDGSFDLSYETFIALFKLKIEPGCERTFQVKATAIPESRSVIAR